MAISYKGKEDGDKLEGITFVFAVFCFTFVCSFRKSLGGTKIKLMEIFVVLNVGSLLPRYIFPFSAFHIYSLSIP